MATVYLPTMGSLIADGFCDDTMGLINFDCQEFNFDGGD